MLPVQFHSAADGILCHSQCSDIHNAMASRILPSHARRRTAWDTIRVLCWGYRNDDDFISIFYIYVNTMWLINKIQLFFHSFFVLFRPQSIPRPAWWNVTSRHVTQRRPPNYIQFNRTIVQPLPFNLKFKNKYFLCNQMGDEMSFILSFARFYCKHFFLWISFMTHFYSHRIETF